MRWIDEVMTVALEHLPKATAGEEEEVSVAPEAEKETSKSPARAH